MFGFASLAHDFRRHEAGRAEHAAARPSPSTATLSLSQMETSPVSGSKKMLPKEMSL